MSRFLIGILALWSKWKKEYRYRPEKSEWERIYRYDLPKKKASERGALGGLWGG